ncbi:RPAP1-like protein [Staphylotrichum tortipilum]|uniref:RPAP1-like protein n=1 Tax=Staphylotrichum tortipilum TaxID=2831512 RepID=A0AAN6MDB0_9PEZI|nr:RPAP1-like protein [Staphylotrichum longicolle]
MDPTLEVLDVKEREVGEATPPTFPSPSAPSPSTTGFPAPKKRASAFKQQRQKQNQHAQPTAAQQPGPLSKGDTTLDERRGIHDENTAPPSVPDLDPSDPDFLEAIHKKFFPTLPADPSKLAWMAPLPTPHSPADRESPYYPGQSSLPVSALRFDFTGRLLPPRESRALPSNLGLHHHGEAPEAAGYTIPELARLARSAVAAQRCLAYQTLGRILYRLGRGDWGAGAGGRDGDEDDLAFALWRCLKEGRVLESLEEEASLPEGRGHLSCKSYAVEAIWLFEKGGWKEKWRGL